MGIHGKSKTDLRGRFPGCWTRRPPTDRVEVVIDDLMCCLHSIVPKCKTVGDIRRYLDRRLDKLTANSGEFRGRIKLVLGLDEIDSVPAAKYAENEKRDEGRGKKRKHDARDEKGDSLKDKRKKKKSKIDEIRESWERGEIDREIFHAKMGTIDRSKRRCTYRTLCRILGDSLKAGFARGSAEVEKAILPGFMPPADGAFHRIDDERSAEQSGETTQCRATLFPAPGGRTRCLLENGDEIGEMDLGVPCAVSGLLDPPSGGGSITGDILVRNQDTDLLMILLLNYTSWIRTGEEHPPFRMYLDMRDTEERMAREREKKVREKEEKESDRRSILRLEEEDDEVDLPVHRREHESGPPDEHPNGVFRTANGVTSADVGSVCCINALWKEVVVHVRNSCSARHPVHTFALVTAMIKNDFAPLIADGTVLKGVGAERIWEAFFNRPGSDIMKGAIVSDQDVFGRVPTDLNVNEARVYDFMLLLYQKKLEPWIRKYAPADERNFRAHSLLPEKLLRGMSEIAVVTDAKGIDYEVRKEDMRIPNGNVMYVCIRQLTFTLLYWCSGGNRDLKIDSLERDAQSGLSKWGWERIVGKDGKYEVRSASSVYREVLKSSGETLQTKKKF